LPFQACERRAEQPSERTAPDHNCFDFVLLFTLLVHHNREEISE